MSLNNNHNTDLLNHSDHNNTNIEGTPRSGAGLDEWIGGASREGNLNLDVLYDFQVVNGLGGIFCDSESIASKVIAKIISSGGDMLYDNYLKLKMDNHSITRTYNLLDYLTQQEYLAYDTINESLAHNGIVEDLEPITSHSENWKGLSVNIEKPQEIANASSTTNLNKSIMNATSHSRRSRGSIASLRKTDSADSPSKNRESLIATRSIFESEKQGGGHASNSVANKLVDLSVPHEIIREEEQLRVLKERETVIKQEKLAQEAVRMQEMKEQQARLKGSQDLNKKQFTYDFDGKFIMTNPIKVEKLPPFSYAVSHNITKAVDSIATASGNNGKTGSAGKTNSNTNITKDKPTNNNSVNTSVRLDGFDDKRNSKKLLAPLQPVVAATSKPLFMNSSAVDPARDVFEHFNMASGVTLIESMKPKAGAKFGADFDFIANQNQSMLNASLSSMSSQSIRMTKSQYNIITRSGNLSRQNGNPAAAGGSKNNNNKFSDEMDLFNGNNESSLANQSMSFMLNESKNRQNLSSMLQQTKRSSHQTSLIKITSSTKLLESIVSNDFLTKEETELKEKQAKLRYEAEVRRAESLKAIPKNPIDEFNLQIAQNKHISEKRGGVSDHVFPPLLVPKPNEYLRSKQAIGFLPQNPRERVPRHVMIASIAGKRLPPPGLGMTLGHGITAGFNPEQLDVNDRYSNSILNASSGIH